MTWKKRLNWACMLATAAFVLLTGYFLWMHFFLYALLSLGGIVICTETRVRMGYRGPRKTLFPIHLALCTAYILSLLLLVIGFQEVWSIPFAWFSYAGMAITGIMLIHQSWHIRESIAAIDTTDYQA